MQTDGNPVTVACSTVPRGIVMLVYTFSTLWLLFCLPYPHTLSPSAKTSSSLRLRKFKWKYSPKIESWFDVYFLAHWQGTERDCSIPDGSADCSGNYRQHVLQWRFVTSLHLDIFPLDWQGSFHEDFLNIQLCVICTLPRSHWWWVGRAI